MKNLDQIFINGFLFELNKLNLITTKQESELRADFSKLFLHSTINNKNIIGSMNNHIAIIDFYKNEYEEMKDYFNTRTLNEIPHRQLDYEFPYVIMKKNINLLFKSF